MKALKNAIMRRSNVEGKYLKSRDPEVKKLYKKQKHYCSWLYKKGKKKYYSKLDLRNITDNKTFWQQ